MSRKLQTAVTKRLNLRLRKVIFLIFLTAGSAFVQAEPQTPTIAIIIDDMGNHKTQGERLIELPYPLTLSFLPHRKHTASLARKAFRQEKEIMLHAPMENTQGLALGPGGLTSQMSPKEIKQSLREAIESVPYVQGVNNHMGSMLTQKADHMQWVMEEIHRSALYFVDSRTIAYSVAAKVSQQQGIPTLARDVFLDHVQTPEAVAIQFQRLIDKAKNKGFAIAIGHPHKVTVDLLEKALPMLDEQGISIATISGMWAVIENGKPMFRNQDKNIVVDSLLAKRAVLNTETLTQ